MVSSETVLVQIKHKQESECRINRDSQYKQGIQNNLDLWTDPLNPYKLQEKIINIVSEKIESAAVNIHKAPNEKKN